MRYLFAVLLIGILFLFTTRSAEAATRVRGYYTPRGTYVQSYYRSNANSYKFDNYSARGNYNPYSGRAGTVNWWR